jgi:hypothetical protein
VVCTTKIPAAGIEMLDIGSRTPNLVASFPLVIIAHKAFPSKGS